MTGVPRIDAGWVAVGIGVGYLNATVLGLSGLENIGVMMVFSFFGMLAKESGNGATS